MRSRQNTRSILSENADSGAGCSRVFGIHACIGERRHSGIGYMTPHSVHYGLAAAMRVTRHATLDAAFLANPKRFKNRRPVLPSMPTAAWINPSPEETTPTSDPITCALN